jgi:hypothetical protein
MPQELKQPWKKWYDAKKPAEAEENFQVKTEAGGNAGTMHPGDMKQVDLSKPKQEEKK